MMDSLMCLGTHEPLVKGLLGLRI
ncbi:hypothetical protein LINPERHAP1_LOCUS21387 [Linum perenne]